MNYLRLFGKRRRSDAENRAHFLTVASRQMRQILVTMRRVCLSAKQCRP